MSKQTAVKWLKDQIECFGNKHELQMSWATLDELLEQAKQMEREQIIEAANNGCKGMCMIDTSRDGKNYYNETYGGQDEN